MLDDENSLPKDDQETVNTQNLVPTEAEDLAKNSGFNAQFVKQYVSSSLPMLIEQLNNKDQQIDQLSKTVTSLVERNTALQTRLLDYEASYYKIGGDDGSPPKSSRPWGNESFWQSKHFLIIVGLLIFLILSLKAFDYFGNQLYRDNYAMFDKYNDQWKDYTEMTVQYQDKIENLQTEQQKKEQEIQKQSYTIDTLTKALARVATQLNQEGGKSATINTLTQQLSQRETDIGSLKIAIDSLQRALLAERKQLAAIEAKNDLLQEMQEKEKQSQSNTSANSTGFSINILYLLILLLLSAVIFMALDRKK